MTVDYIRPLKGWMTLMSDTTADRPSPLSTAMLALALPFRRPVAFLRSGGIALSCWIGAAIILSAIDPGSVPDGPLHWIGILGFSLLGTGFAGLLSFNLQWHRFAFNWPIASQQLPLFCRENIMWRVLFPFSGSRNRHGFLRSVLHWIAGISIMLLGLAAAVFTALSYGLAAACGVLTFVLVLLASVQTSLDWPLDISRYIDSARLSHRELGAVTVPSLGFRLMSLFPIYLAVGVLFVAAQLAGDIAAQADQAWWHDALVHAAQVIALLLSVAWIAGVKSLLYARHSGARLPVGAFD
jgi:hypothetical protein